MLDTFLKPRFLQDVGANAQGMGLGLAVVLEIVQMHQGSVHLESGEPSFFSPKKNACVEKTAETLVPEVAGRERLQLHHLSELPR